MKYKIDIHGLGYEDYTKEVDRPAMSKVTKTDILQAKVEWCEHNDIDVDSVELPFHRVYKA